MSSENNGAAQFVYFRKKFYHFPGVVRVQVAGRFVGNQNVRPRNHGPGDGDPLFLAAGEFGRKIENFVPKAHHIQNLGHEFVDFLLRPAPDFQRKSNVLKDVFSGKEPEVLKNNADVTAKFRKMLGFQFIDFVRTKKDLSFGRPVFADQEFQDGGLAGAGAADDGHKFGRLNFETYLFQGTHAVVTFGYVLKNYHVSRF